MSLNAIHNIVPSLCPKSYANGKLSNDTGAFLATDFLNLSPRSSASGSGLSLAQKLAKLHSTPAPILDGYDEPMFGFPVPTCCGDTQQDNSFKASWAGFYADNRLRGILRSAEKSNGRDAELSSLVDQTASIIVPRLLRDGHLKAPGGSKIVPVVVHGDLWSGNHGRGTIGKGGLEEVVYDPSSFYAHGEYDWGIMKMFGGFGESFEREYFKEKGGRDEPVEEWKDRVALYEL
jgi:fructosamine-3-kinase